MSRVPVNAFAQLYRPSVSPSGVGRRRKGGGARHASASGRIVSGVRTAAPDWLALLHGACYCCRQPSASSALLLSRAHVCHVS